MCNRALTLLMALLFLLMASCSQSGGSKVRGKTADGLQPGRYVGSMEVPGMELELAFEFNHADEAWSATIDIPQQMVAGWELIDLVVEDREVQMALESELGRADFYGTYDARTSTLSGEMEQQGVRFPFSTELFDAKQLKADAQQLLLGYPATVQLMMDQLKVPGTATGVVREGEVVYVHCAGQRDIAGDLPVTEQTMFSIGSVTKSFTATAIAALVDEGVVDWDVPVSEYLTEFSMHDETATKLTTLRDLCSHRTGLPTNDVNGCGWSDHYTSRDDVLKKLPDVELKADFRTLFQYSNLGYAVAGIAAGRASDQSWEELVKHKVLDPLKMNSTVFTCEELEAAEDHAIGYIWQSRPESGEPGFEVRENMYDVVNLGPSGSIQSNLTDMLKYAAFHMGSGVVSGEQLISCEQLAMMHSSHMPVVQVTGQLPMIPVMNYGLGWTVYPYRGKYIVEHGGSVSGFSCSVLLVPEEQLGIVVLSNVAESKMPMVAALYAAELLMGLDPEPGSLSMLKLFSVSQEMDANSSCC